MDGNQISELMALKVFHWAKSNKLDLSGQQYQDLYQIIVDICVVTIEAKENYQIGVKK